MNLSVISFDLDGTLWDVRPTIERAERRLHDWLAERAPDLVQRYTPSQLRALNHEVIAEHPEWVCDLSQIRKQSIALALQRCGYSRAWAEPAFELYFEARNRVDFFVGVEALLVELTQDYRLMAVSNGNSDLAKVGLAEYFDFHVHAGQIGSRKPEPQIFHHACEQMAVSPQSVVHIGDELETDVAGACRAGIRSIWFNPTSADARDNAYENDDYRPNAEVRSLVEIPAALRALAFEAVKR